MRIVDMHCDTLSELLERRRQGNGGALRENDLQLDLTRMKAAGYLLQNFAMYVDQGRCRDVWEEACALYKVYCGELEANKDLLAPVLRYEDISANERAGKLSALLTVEEGAVCKGEPERLRRLYEMGVRMMTLTWNYPNEIGFPNLNALKGKQLQETGGDAASFLFTPDRLHGLTKRGREFVEEMEGLGMIVDVSHLSDKGFYDVLECSKRPFVASHSNARGICPAVRNLTDDMIRRIAQRGGCVGLNFCVDFLMEEKKSREADGKEQQQKSGRVCDRRQEILQAAADHAKHLVLTGGIEVLGLGSDFDGISENEALPGVQSMKLLWEALHKAGFTQGQLDKIFAGNVLRVYREILG